ncbi:hypothetical protein EV677_3020 [Herminiimonas fonticola]|uniref:Uncharacterized protein n=2 Tax=Herminiimonas fonticola TaxID=303380 RepID=A0A4R6FZ72_9BURK|nr:hypothetical protein Hfont_2177 [Herminiimonas fonticola]TDN87309.1 hypothetical protein EV677_3020 [Herminiimonas fonticola]
MPGLWAVSDSRVSSSNSVLTDNYPKLSAIHAMSYQSGDFPRKHPRHLFSIGFAFAGSTLIGSTVREMLSTLLSGLKEIDYYDAPDLSFDEKIPSLKEVADLAGRIASKYVVSLGVHYPSNARIELVIFGHCVKTNSLRIFRLRNSPGAPAIVTVVEMPLHERDFFVFGDKPSEVEIAILEKRTTFQHHSLDWDRAPILVMLEIAQDPNFSSIGGSLQLCATGKFGIRHLPLTKPGEQLFVGFDMFEGNPLIGGFSYVHSFSLSHPNSDGWECSTKTQD